MWWKEKKIKTRYKILLCYFIFVIVNVTLGWVAFFVKGSTPDTLLTLVLGVGGVVEAATALIGLVELFKPKDPFNFGGDN